MKPAATDLGAPRRMFLAVIVLLVLVLAWNLSKPWRTGMQEHRVGGASVFNSVFGRPWIIPLGTNQLYWGSWEPDGLGYLYLEYPSTLWQFSPCARTNLHAVTPQDAQGEYFGVGPGGARAFGKDWHTNSLIIRDGQILLVRNSTDTQTVYAVEVLQQRDTTGYLRSRKILPAPR